MPNKPYYRWIIPPENWDKKLELTPNSSMYYALMVQKMGKELADYYWNRRYIFETKQDEYYTKLCKEITKKSEEFLKSRGIII